VNNVLNIQLIEQLIVANNITPTLAVFCQQIYQVFQSQLKTCSELTFYQRQDNEFVEHINLPDAKPTNEPLTAKSHQTLWSAITSNQQYIEDFHVFIPLGNGTEVNGLLKFTIEDTEEQSYIHWSLLKTILSREFDTIETTNDDEQIGISQHLLENIINVTYQISLTENDTEITQLLFKSLPESVSHIILYRFDTPLLVKNNPAKIRLTTVADRNSTTQPDETLTLKNDTTFSDGLTNTLISGEFVTQNHTGELAHKLPSAVVQSIQSTPIQSFVLSGLRVGKQLMGFIVFGSEQPIDIDNQYHHHFRILSDQMSVTYENQDLLRRTEVILMETQVLYAISNELVLTTDLMSMLKVLFLYFGENADSASLLEIEYDNVGLLQDAIIRYQLHANETDVVNPDQSLTDYVPLEELQQLQKTWLINESPIYFVDDSSQDTASVTYNLFRTQKIASCILIPLIENDKITHLISINWKQAHPINLQTRNLLKAVRNQLTIIFENQRLLQNTQNSSAKLEEQVQIQQAINELATFASNSQDEKSLLDKGAETLLQTLHVDHVGIMTTDEDREIATLISDIPEQHSAVQSIPVEPKLREQLEQGKYITIENTKITEGFADNALDPLDEIGVESTVLMPLLNLSGQLIGSVGLDRFRGKISLTDEQIRIASLISAQLASQLQNLRLLKDSQHFANQMQQIARFGETIQARLELSEILQTTLHFTNRILNIDYINIVLYDVGSQSLVIKAYHRDNEDVILPPHNPTMPIENTVIGTVWKNRDPIYVRHIDTSPYTNPFAPTIKTLYGVALISQGVTRGAIEIGKSDTEGIRNVDRSVLIQMANQLAVALENATTYVQSQRLAQNKALANEIALQLQQQVDMDSLVNTTVTELVKALGAKRARIRLGIQQVTDDK